MRIGCFIILFAVAASHADAAVLGLQAAQRDALATGAVGARVAIDGFPDGRGRTATIVLRRIDVYAPNARIIAIDANGEHALPRSKRSEWIGYDASGATRVQLGFDPGLRNIAGTGSSPAGAFAIRATPDGRGFAVVPAEDALPAGVQPQVIPGDDAVPGIAPLSQPLSLNIAPTQPAGALRIANVAVDVDRELLVNRFGGTSASNTNAATAWIADLFATMNVMYERDLSVTLQQGTTIFRTGATPYAIAANTAADNPDLNNFGTYWQNNHAGVQRDFAMLLSGQMTSGNQASGIAWINAYCRTQNTGGSYSVNKVFTNSNISVDLSARLVGHELGHNFGAAHTHCTNATSGAYAASSNTIDKCVSGASMSNGACYSGATSCPASGPGAPNGTIMSYCNTISCGADHQNVLQFHPAQVAALSVLIANNTPSCLSLDTDLIFRDGFD